MDRRETIRQKLLNQSLAVRTPVLPNVRYELNRQWDEYDSVRNYETDIIKWLKPVIDLTGWYVYPMNGITEGLNWWAGNTEYKIWSAVGEYQWIKHRNSGMAPHWEYQSLPSAIDGNWYDVCGHTKVALDLAYVGSTAVKKIELPDSVEACFYSLSKAFGVRNVRTGWYFTRKPDADLERLVYGAKYYNYHARFVAEKIISNFDIDYVHNKMYPQQKEICDLMSFKPSDSVWLATTMDYEYNKFVRGPSAYCPARICLAEVMTCH